MWSQLESIFSLTSQGTCSVNCTRAGPALRQGDPPHVFLYQSVLVTHCPWGEGARSLRAKQHPMPSVQGQFPWKGGSWDPHSNTQCSMGNGCPAPWRSLVKASATSIIADNNISNKTIAYIAKNHCVSYTKWQTFSPRPKLCSASPELFLNWVSTFRLPGLRSY